MVNGILCNLPVQLCQKLNCTMIWLNFNGWNGKFAFDLHDRDILFFKNLFHPSLATSANSLCYGNPNNQKKILSGQVEGLADYLATEFGDRFDKKKFIKALFDSNILKMIQRQDNLPKNCFTKEFVAKVRQQQRVRKATEYSECKEYFHRIGIKSERQYYA